MKRRAAFSLLMLLAATLLFLAPVSEAAQQLTSDKNKDGKPDSYKTFLQGGREIVLREDDRNFDGRIDRRLLTQWNGDKKIPIYNNNRMTYLPNPGYVTLWREEDNDYDGTIDVHYQKPIRGAVAGAISKVGQPMDSKPNDGKPVKPETQNEKPKSLSERMNERHGLNS